MLSSFAHIETYLFDLNLDIIIVHMPFSLHKFEMKAVRFVQEDPCKDRCVQINGYLHRCHLFICQSGWSSNSPHEYFPRPVRIWNYKTVEWIFGKFKIFNYLSISHENSIGYRNALFIPTKLVLLLYLFSRFTGILAKASGHVTAVDFMPSFVEKNREINGHMGNIDFKQADVMALDLPLNR